MKQFQAPGVLACSLSERDPRREATVIPHAHHRDVIQMGDVHTLETALGLPLSTYQFNLATMWDAVAHECGLPDVEALKQSMDGPGINVIPHWLWNAAVDIANRRR